MEFLIELVVQVVGELFFQGIGEALSRRWGKLVFGLLLGFGGGWVWSALVAHDKAPVIITVVAVLELAAIPGLSGQSIGRWRLDRRVLTEFAAIGAAVAVGRWVGYSFEDHGVSPR